MGAHSPTVGLRGVKYSAFEGGTRVPFIVHWPAMVKEPAVKEELVSQIDFLDVMASITGVGCGEPLSSDGMPAAAATWLGGGGDRSFVMEMAANHTLSILTPEWKYIQPKGGPAMVPWGPKIETGYSAEPQLFMRVGSEYDETNDVAAGNALVVEQLARLLNEVYQNNGNK